MDINKFTKITLICAVLLVAFSVFYYFVILPHTNKTLLEDCLNDADESYVDSFMALYKKENQGKLPPINSFSLDDLVGGNIKLPTYLLPANKVDRLEELRQQAKDNCFKMYPQR